MNTTEIIMESHYDAESSIHSANSAVADLQWIQSSINSINRRIEDYKSAENVKVEEGDVEGQIHRLHEVASRLGSLASELDGLSQIVGRHLRQVAKCQGDIESQAMAMRLVKRMTEK